MVSDSRYPSSICIFIVGILYFTIAYFIFNTCTTINPFQNIFIRSSTDKIFSDNTIKNDIQLSSNYIRNYFQVQDHLSLHWLQIIKHYISLPLDNSYGSHKLVLLAASILTAQHATPVMEMGCGYHSTILLHRIIVNEQKRFLLSTDTDREWLSKFEANMSSSLHHFRHINQTSAWDNIGTDQPRWSIVFIDHKPGERRVIDIIRLANVSDIVIVHDTEALSYNYEQGLSQYPYRYRYKYLPVHTDVLSKSNGTLFQNIQHLLEMTLTMKLAKL